MSLWNRLLRRNTDLEKDLADELQAHLAMAARDHIERGECPEQASASARRDLGNELLIKETTRAMWGWRNVDTLVQNFKYAARQLRRNPGLSLIAITTLGVGLGATTAMFSIVNGVLLQPLKFAQPDKLYIARTIPPPTAKIDGNFPINARHFQEWRTRCESCESVSLAQYQDLTLTGVGEPQRLPALKISSDFFRTLGIRPLLGRDFLATDEGPGNFDKVLLTDLLWRTRFAGDPSIVGRTIRLNGETYTVVGVMPETLHLPKGAQWGNMAGPTTEPLIFRPIDFDASRADRVGSLNYISVIRLKPGVSPQHVAQELTALAVSLVTEFKLDLSIALLPMQAQVTRGARSALWLMLATMGAVLLIICVNLGNLILVRTIGRDHETSVRLAMGADRGRLFAMVLQEVLLLVALGGALGLTLAQAGLGIFIAVAPPELPRLEDAVIDWRVLGFASLAVIISTMACALFPAWRLANATPLNALKSGAFNATTGSRGLRIREWLVGVEVALCTLLLVGGGLLAVSFYRVLTAEKGFEVSHVVTQDLSFLNPKYAGGGRRRFVENLLPKLAAIPGVRYAGAINQVPLRGAGWMDGLRDPNQPEPSVEQEVQADLRFAGPGYFQALGIPLKQGRYLDASDRDKLNAVVTESVARHLWPGQDPIGKQVRGANSRGVRPPLVVVGVVGETPSSVEGTPTPTVYEHYWRLQPVGMSLVLRAETDPHAIIRAVHSLLAQEDPDMAIPAAETMAQILDKGVAPRRFELYLTSAFAIAGLLLATLGVYGVISFTVARRTPEIGIRMALGAPASQISRMVLREGMVPVIAGLLMGIAAALALGRFIASELYGVSAYDPITISAVALVLLAAGTLACWLPARRAARIDPIRALRFE